MVDAVPWLEDTGLSDRPRRAGPASRS